MERPSRFASPVQQLLFRFPPIQGEALGSWITRLSCANGFSHPWAFLSSYGILRSHDLWPTACDEGLQEWLAAVTGLDPALISRFEVDLLAQALGNSARISGPARWLLHPIGVLKGFPGQRFSLCPYCLADDQVPHWRDEWRSGTVTRCPVHHAMLVDRCSSCGAFLSLFKYRKRNITQCDQCGEALCAQRGVESRCDSDHWPAPLKIALHEMPVAVSNEQLFWDGIWVLAKHVSNAKTASQLLRTSMARDRMGALLEELSLCKHGRHLEGMAVGCRHEILCFVHWLCRDWPERLVELFSQANLTVATFTVRGVQLPYWLHRVVHDQLNRRRYGVSSTEIEAAYQLIQHRSVQRCSRNKIKQALGVTESKCIGDVVPIYTRPFTVEDLCRLVHELQEMLRQTSCKRAQRAARVRDVLIIAMCALSGNSFQIVIRWSVDEFKGVWTDIQESDTVVSWRRLLIGVASDWLREYEQEVRPIFCCEADPVRQERFFITRYGEPFLGMGLPGLLGRALARSGAPDIWRGVKLLSDLLIHGDL